MADAGGNPAPVVVQAPPSIHHEVATGIVSGLSAEPTLLLIMLINIAFIACAAWFLLKQESYRHEERVTLGDLLRICIERASVGAQVFPDGGDSRVPARAGAHAPRECSVADLVQLGEVDCRQAIAPKNVAAIAILQ